jgi:fructosamine-3-kinase
LKDDLVSELERALGSSVKGFSRVSGGDINDAYRVSLASGEDVFVKTHPNAPASMFEAEAAGLKWLAEVKALKLPEVIAVGKFLALRWLEPGRKSRHFDEQLGHGLASLHRFDCSSFGFDSANFIGRLTQSNRPWPSFVEFYREERLRPQATLAVRSQRIDNSFYREIDRLLDRLGVVIDSNPPPSRLHGDLWCGNLLVGPDGEPWLIDPAAYAGDREVDLAMMRLFGGFSERVFQSYEETFPLLPGHRERSELYQLYPLLVHVNLFGGSYVSQARRIVTKYL